MSTSPSKTPYILLAALLTASLTAGAATTVGAQTTDRIVPATEEGYSLDSPEMARLYGPGVFTMTNLANTRMTVHDGKQLIASNRFRATHSGDLAALRLYWPVGPGYSAGTGGKMKVTVLPDDGSDQHLPDLTAEPIGVTYFEPNLQGDTRPKTEELTRPLEFGTTTMPLESGKLYHVVQENVDPNPDQNYISSDHGATHKDNGKLGRWLNTTDWSTLMGHRDANNPDAPFTWKNLTTEGSGDKTFVPIMEVTYTDGTIQGNFDMESGSVYPKRTRIVTNNAPVRERFTPVEQRRISGISVATATETGGALAWSIKEGDRVLASGHFEQPQANFTTHKMKNNDIASFTWYDAALAEDVVFEPGKTYDVEFTAVGDSRWVMGDHSNGSAYKVSAPAAFTESQAQHLHNGEWINTNHWDHTKTGNGTNWPVVLHLVG